jgi:hypothetical protein
MLEAVGLWTALGLRDGEPSPGAQQWRDDRVTAFGRIQIRCMNGG